jgi:single-strand DNA-binding protein
MTTFNQIILLGNLGQDPQTKQLGTNRHVVNMSLATQRFHKTSDDQWEKSTDWHNIALYNYPVEQVQNLKKGMKVLVVGRMQFNKVGEGENVRYYPQVVADKLVYGDNIKSSESVSSTENDDSNFNIPAGADDFFSEYET